MAANLRLKIENLDYMLKRLDRRFLLAEPFTKFLKRVTNAVFKFAQMQAPVGKTGRLKAGLQTKFDTREVPTWGKVEVSGDVRRGKISYPAILEYSQKSHYNLSGQPTRHWLTGSKDLAKGEFDQAAQDLKSEVEELWQR